jgi:hypothetical protein
MERFDGSERELDLRLREALAPRPEAVERIVRGALAPEERRPAERFRLAPALTVVAALVLAAGLLVLAPYPRRPEPQAKISIENVGGLLVVHHREGGRWIIRGSRSGGPAEGSLPSRSLIVIYGGKP